MELKKMKKAQVNARETALGRAKCQLVKKAKNYCNHQGLVV
jgi:hypothetical protein